MKSKASLLSIGWLEPSHPFQTGETPPDVVTRIAIATPLLRKPMRGIQGCPYCGHQHIYESLQGKNVLLGMSEVWFPSSSREVVYIAPSLLLHYVKQHQYLPPDEVVQEILGLSSDPNTWDTPGGSYRKLVKKYGD